MLPVPAVVDAVPVAGEGAPADRGARSREDRHGARAVFRVELASGQQADVVDAHVGHVADEEAVLERGPAAVQEIEGGAGDLRAVVAEDAVAKEHRVLDLVEVLDRDAAGARTGVIVVDVDPLDGRIRARVNLDAAAVGIEVQRLADVIGFDRGLLARTGGEVVGAGDLEAAQHGPARDAVAEIDDVVHDRRVAGRRGVGEVGIGGGQGDVSHRFQGDAIMPGVEPDERLPLGGRAVGAGVHVDGLVDGIARGRLERVLNPVLGIDMMPGARAAPDRGGVGAAPVLSGEAPDGERARRQQEPKEGATLVLGGRH